MCDSFSAPGVGERPLTQQLPPMSDKSAPGAARAAGALWPTPSPTLTTATGTEPFTCNRDPGACKALPGTCRCTCRPALPQPNLHHTNPGGCAAQHVACMSNGHTSVVGLLTQQPACCTVGAATDADNGSSAKCWSTWSHIGQLVRMLVHVPSAHPFRSTATPLVSSCLLARLYTPRSTVTHPPLTPSPYCLRQPHQLASFLTHLSPLSHLVPGKGLSAQAPLPYRPQSNLAPPH